MLLRMGKKNLIYFHEKCVYLFFIAFRISSNVMFHEKEKISITLEVNEEH